MATVAANRPVSNIAVAFAAQSASNNIPIPRDGVDPNTSDHRRMLLTPPNSISPTLPAQKHKPGMRGGDVPYMPLHPDSDVDLQDAVEHAASQHLHPAALSKEALAGLEAAGQITPAMLAKHHLPKIFSGHGSLPVRDIMAHLAQTVPGYSSIPPAKARRLVVAALEHRAGGGLHGEVVFEKVGWGRWHVKGENGQGVPIAHSASPSGPTPPASVDSAGRLVIPRSRFDRDEYCGSWAAGSMAFSRHEEMADNMSLDGSDDSDSDADDMDLDDIDDQTDEEDWSALGPELLRNSYRGPSTEYRDYNYLSRTSGARYRSASAQVQAQSVPHSRPGHKTTPAFNNSNNHHNNNNTSSASRINSGFVHNNGTASPLGVLENRSELEAVEALIAMGSM
ncbi:uncharacterized protein EI97DRAFT_75784 [Westerdykella ornata]|uniref:Sin3 binding protein-domain-containing protein n=1 Tax=Westerdykella ornata TaxID=318751 RepID=A0A6A6JII7_WESOR|nr:uncharacterized protein EI97DRAFT_75784 [Westerdykella ornata]KAF2275456.1 hypothetical protein EI97DRAFT_75784 [Westerdykella ornata]